MNDQTIADLKAHAEAEYPRESCGLVVIVKGREKYIPSKNSATGEEHFIISAEEYAAAEELGEIVAIVHSHPNVMPEPSEADRTSCEASGLAWHIVRVDTDGEGANAGDIVTIKPCGYKAPLVGRQFFHGVLDCYTLIRDWYAEVKGITLPDFQRHDDWWNDGASDIYTNGFPRAGFEKIPAHDQPEIGDVIFMQIRSKNGVPNHAAVYIGDGLMLHHLHGRLSSRDVYGGYYQEVTRFIVRYKGLPSDAGT
ncbi:C40 family peptidase [Undibacterium sp. MH2W]|uniref:C40 family peptidase n=1 Tax=Undibacterium sp. MH2W TaxID=3413044 RepID=UPI003BF103A5